MSKPTRSGHETHIVQRLNITFGKFGALKYTGNLDVAKIWERVLRRADLPILYTQGFNTRPRIQLATALSLGITSECEILDVALRETIPLEGIPERLDAVSPPGLKTYKVEEVPPESPALQQLVRSAEYRIRFEDGIERDKLQTLVDELLAKDRIVVVKHGKKRKSSADIRPLIHSVEINENDDLIVHIDTGERGSLRPDELVQQLGLQDEFFTVHRLRLHIDDYYQRRMKYWQTTDKKAQQSEQESE